MAKPVDVAAKLEPAKPLVTALVKKDLENIRKYASALDKIIKGPGPMAIRVCECCVQVS